MSIEVLLLNTPLFKNKLKKYNEDSLPPLGLGYIATNLKENNISVKLIDAVESNISLKSLLKIIKKESPEYIALNVFTTNLDIVHELVESIEEKSHFIIGGPAVRNIYQIILSWEISNFLDIVIGDGDLVVSAIVQEKPLDIIFQEENRRVVLESSNSPYFLKDISKVSLDRSFFSNQPLKNVMGQNEVSIITSRGCIYNCAFCAASRLLNREIPVRERSLKSIKSEIQYLIKEYKSLDSIRILDDLFLKNAESIKKVVQMFEQIPLQWQSMAHILSFKNLNDDDLSSLKNSGCSELFIGIESGSSRILKKIRKMSDPELIKVTLERLFQAKINVKGYFIFGFETETLEDMKLTYELASYLKLRAVKNNVNFRTSVFQFRPYHGTEIYYDIINKRGNIPPMEHDASYKERKLFNFKSGNFSEVSDEKLKQFINLTNGLNK